MADLNINLEKLPELSAYGEGLSAQKTTRIELKSVYGISKLRDLITETGTGTVTNDKREYACNVTGTSSKSELLSTERGRYVSGKEAEYGLGIRLGADTVTGDTVAKWGAFSDINGMYFGLDSTGLFVAVLDDTTETKIYQSNWNGDTLDGNGASGLTLTATEGNIYNVNFTWYGYGVIEFTVQLKNIEGVQTVTAHRFIVDGKTSIKNPNLPIGASVEQSTASNNFTLYVGGRQFAIVGTYNPAFRLTSDYVINKTVPLLGTNPTPLIAFKQKTAFSNIDGKFNGVSLITDNQVVLEVYVADSVQLSGGSYVDPTRTIASETSFEVNKTATSFDASTGNIVFRELAQGGGRGNNQALRSIVNQVDDIPEGKILVVCAFATDTEATVDAVCTIREEW